MGSDHSVTPRGTADVSSPLTYTVSMIACSPLPTAPTFPIPYLFLGSLSSASRGSATAPQAQVFFRAVYWVVRSSR